MTIHHITTFVPCVCSKLLLPEAGSDCAVLAGLLAHHLPAG